MDSFSQVRRVREQMSEAVGHDIRKLIAAINERRERVASRIIDPGTKAEQTDAGERETVLRNRYRGGGGMPCLDG